MTTKRMLFLRGEHRYVFRYAVGREAEVCVALAEAASNPSLDFSWKDAVIGSHALRRQVETEGKPPCRTC